MIAMAAGNLLILVPHYIATVRVERKVVEARHSDIAPAKVALAVRTMNRITYGLLTLVVSWWLVAAIATYFDQSKTDDVMRPQSTSVRQIRHVALREQELRSWDHRVFPSFVAAEQRREHGADDLRRIEWMPEIVRPVTPSNMHQQMAAI